MGFDSSITAFFGGDTTNLRQSTEEASIMVKGFGTQASRAVREIGQGFLGAVVFTEAVKGIKDIADMEITAAENARDLGGAITDQQQAWLDLAGTSSTAWEATKNDIGDVISLLPRTGEAIGGLIANMGGVEPVVQDMYQRIANDADHAMAQRNAVVTKYNADLVANFEAVNSKIAEGWRTLQGDTLSTDDQLAKNLDEQSSLKTFMLSQDKDSLAYAQNLVQLQTLEHQANLLDYQVQQQGIAADKEDFETKKGTMTLLDQMNALLAQQDQYEDIAQKLGEQTKEGKLYANAAAEIGKQIAADTLQVNQATMLSEQDRLNLFIHETASLQDQNTLSDDQVSLLQKQQQLKNNNWQIDQMVVANYATGTKAQQDQLATLVLQTAELQKQANYQSAAIAADQQQQAETAKQLALDQQITAAVAAAAQPGTATGPGGLTRNANGTLGPPPGADMQKDENGEFFNANGEGPGINPGNMQFNPGISGVGFVDEQYQQAQSVANVKQNLASQIANLQNQITQYSNSDIQSYEQQVPALQKLVQSLQQRSQNAYQFLYQPGYTDALGTGAAGAQVPPVQPLQVQSATSLANIDKNLSKLVGGVG